MNINRQARRTLVHAALAILPAFAAGCGYAASPYASATPSARSEQFVPEPAPMRESAPRGRDVQPNDGCFWNGPMYGAAHAALIGVGPATREYMRRLWALGGLGPPCALASLERRP